MLSEVSGVFKFLSMYKIKFTLDVFQSENYNSNDLDDKSFYHPNRDITFIQKGL